jgi:hypothetical protein
MITAPTSDESAHAEAPVLCCHCGSELEPGRRTRRCKKCCSKYSRIHTQRQRLKALSSFVDACAESRDIERVAAICKVTIRRLGGLSGLSQLWADQINEAAKTKRGRGFVLDSIVALTHLMEIAEKPKPAPVPNWRELDDAELDTTIAEMQTEAVLNLIGEHPEIIFTAARALGWRVTPPGAETAAVR